MGFKLTISQCLALILVIASLITFFVNTSSEPVVWDLENLPFQIPDLPEQFEDNGRPRPCVILGTYSPATEFDNGTHLFQSQYRFGWELCRATYYDREEFLDWVAEPIESLNPGAWTREHLSYALCRGYQQCKQQIIELEKQKNVDSVRDLIGYPSYYRLIAPLATGLLGIVTLVYVSRRTRARKSAVNQADA